MIDKLEFGKNSFEPNIRMMSDMREVLFNKNANPKNPSDVAYCFYRGLFLSSKDKTLMAQHKLQFDITIIPANNTGGELAKTKGHYHSLVPGTDITYPEMYQVLSGNALYLLQKVAGDAVLDVVMIEAEPGDIVIIPPNYGHITINCSGAELKMCNWISTEVSSSYAPIESKGGGAYFKLSDGRLVPNTNYRNLPRPRFLKAKFNGHFGIRENMYSLVKRLHLLKFLNKPQEHKELFKYIKQKTT